MDKALEAIARFHLNPRGVFSASTLLLAFAGIGIVILNAWTNTNTAIRKLKLAQSIWKFEPTASALAVLRQQQAGWYKLLLAGLMIAALAVSVLVRFFPPTPAIAAGCTLWLLWSAYLWYYWYSFVIATDKAKANATAATAATATTATPPPTTGEPQPTTWSKRVKDEKQAEDKRLPVTIVTGFLGSGKTTLVKRILHNTVGMKVLVIENEIGSEGIDHELLMQHTAKEEIVLMNNGCICCNGTSPPAVALTNAGSHTTPRIVVVCSPQRPPQHLSEDVHERGLRAPRLDRDRDDGPRRPRAADPVVLHGQRVPEAHASRLCPHRRGQQTPADPSRATPIRGGAP